MLFQLHWQGVANPKWTEFVAQAEFGDGEHDKLLAWQQDICERRKAEMPDGWVPMLCTEDSEYFVLAAPATTGDSHP